MKNYKILENRPPLTNDQIKQGLDFNKLKSDAKIIKAALLKSLIIKISIVATVISISTVIYLNNIVLIPSKEELISANTKTILNQTKKDSIVIHAPIPANNNKILNPAQPEMPNQDKNKENKSQTIGPVASNTLPTLSPLSETINTNEPTNNNFQIVQNDSIEKEKQTTAKTNTNTNKSKTSIKSVQIKQCTLWKTKDFCDLPKQAKFPNSINCNDCVDDYVNCQTLNTDKPNARAIWLTITANGKSKFQIESKLKNIRLVKASNNKTISPIAIALSDKTYIGSNFKAKTFMANYSGQIDIFLFFPEAEIGDTILINNFIETTIQE